MSSELQTLLSSDGPLSTIDTNYNDIIDNIEDKIEAEELRLSNYEDMLIKRFSRLDSYMSTMSGISTSLSSITSSLQNQ